MEKKRAILQRYWGYKAFRPLQEEIIQAVLDRKDVLALLPTGGGKSICFQVPALLREGVTLVISPLIALMQDQVSALRKRRIPAEALHSGLSADEMDRVLGNCVHGAVKLLYLSPERLQTTLFRTYLARMNVSLLAVDEAHCISQWGHDFRPAYGDIASIRPLLPGVPLMALTATATEPVKKDILEKLALQHPLTFQQSFARTNLSLEVRQVDEASQQLFHTLRKHAGTAIVYVNTRHNARQIAEYLHHKGLSTTYYHAGLSATERLQRQTAWIKDAVRIIVATNAFGMGIDKPDVRLVVHLHLPETLEAYYQEAGRAGRDQKPATAIVLYEPEEPTKLLKKIEEAYPATSDLKATYQRLANYHQVAIGSHEGVSYPFDLADFAHTYGYKPTHLYACLQRLGEAKLIAYDNRFAQPAQVHITSPSSQLYAFQISNPDYQPLLNTLKRLHHTYISSGKTNVSLKSISKKIESTQKGVHRQLQALHQLGILHYEPEKKQATLTFLTPRYASPQLPIATTKLQARKKTMRQKANAVVHYMTHPKRCRMQLLLEYFGEISYTRCTRCDHCAKLADLSPPPETKALLQQHIKELLKETPLAPDELLASLQARHPTLTQTTLLSTIEEVIQRTDRPLTQP